MTEASHQPGMASLPDPRRWNEDPGDKPLLRLARASLAGDRAAQMRLLALLHECIGQGRDEEITGALRLATAPAVYRHLWEHACAAVDQPQTGDEPVVARLFAIPLVLIAGAKRKVIIPGIVPDIDEITALLGMQGAVGAARNFGLSNALSSLSALERVALSRAYAWARDFKASGASRDIGAEAIDVAPGREQVHLRFLVGAGIAAPTAPSFLETAANIGTWGMPLTRALARQLAQPGLDLLPVPRPPTTILKAAHAGRCVQLELAFNLFVSNTVRQFRSMVGDPTVVLSAHLGEAGMAEIRISMSTGLDDTLLEGFRWPLHPLDELERVVSTITDLLRECRIGDVRVVESVCFDDKARDRPLFIRAADYDRLALEVSRH